MFLEKVLIRAMHGVHLVARPVTLGVRAAVFDERGQVFLVRHTYVSGWYMPGGGVDPGETAEEAMRRELMEEGNIELEGGPDLVSVHFNRNASNRDHVLFYQCRALRQTAPKRPDREIAEAGFFPPDALPEATTDATRRRLAELTGEREVVPYW
ncbi:NUDIX domain-containing protein [Aurantimonas sp. VKM B-3413]|uniref:NUDIX domain-containing protein n=1 Tax=Aurantimonas sp. VKM B-3413 TaxID=2779401 RepID=UPI001E2AEE91|nr:NUDIX domain-containing protein [Aurantimonas sp. VKM B-3413]MCB8838288.1 NUDIX domain-containing protein [Aurantimonas sp. VKM B-3413]